jgi:hypothetical protein
VLVDTNGKLVRRILYRDLGGKNLKTYEVVRTTKVGDELLPASVRMEHFGEGFVTTVDYQYWRLKAAPPAGIYDAAVTKEKFLPRLQRLLDEAGIGDTLRAEIAIAEKRIEDYERRVREQPEPAPESLPQAQP